LKGSSFLNEAFKEHLKRRLKGEEDDIEINGFTLGGIVETAVFEFEKSTKRRIDINNRASAVVPIAGLRANPQKRFGKNCVQLNRYYPYPEN